MTTVPLKEAKERLEELLAEGEFMVRLDDGTTLQLEVRPAEKPRPVFGSGKGWFSDMSDDFDEPLEDFKDYME